MACPFCGMLLAAPVTQAFAVLDACLPLVLELRVFLPNSAWFGRCRRRKRTI